MIDYEVMGITQKVMADLADVNPSTINKIVSMGNYKPLNKNVSRNIKYSISDTGDIIKRVLSKNLKLSNKWISFYNFKGGVGKTTLCYQISTHLAVMGFNVLVIDADPQGHLSTSLGFNTDENFLTLYDAVVGKVPITEIIKNIYQGLDCVPSNISLTRLEPALNEFPKNEKIIHDVFSKIHNKYDFIIFDTNPTISNINRNIIMSTDLLSVVVETQAYALNGLKILLNDLERFCEESLIKVPELIIIPNKYEERTASSGEAMGILKDYYGNYVIPDFAIRKSEELHTSGKISQPLAFFCRSNSIALEDIKDVIHYILNYQRKNSAAAEI